MAGEDWGASRVVAVSEFISCQSRKGVWVFLNRKALSGNSNLYSVASFRDPVGDRGKVQPRGCQATDRGERIWT